MENPISFTPDPDFKLVPQMKVACRKVTECAKSVIMVSGQVIDARATQRKPEYFVNDLQVLCWKVALLKLPYINEISIQNQRSDLKLAEIT